MTAVPSDAESACLALLEAHLSGPALPDLAGRPESEVDGALRALVKRHGAAVEMARRYRAFVEIFEKAAAA